MVIPSLYLEFCRERIEENMAEIRYLTRDIGEMNRLREQFPDDWEIQEMTRAIIFDETQIIEALRKEIEIDQRTVKGRTVQGPAGI